VVFDNQWKEIVHFSLSSAAGLKNPTSDPKRLLNQKKYAVFSTNQKQTKTTCHLACARCHALGPDSIFPALGTPR